MDRKIIVLDILCFESFFNSSIGRKSKSEIFYLHESNLFFFIKNIYSKYFDVKFTNLGNLSYSENRLGSRTIYEAIQEETKRDIFSFLESQPFKKNLSTYIKTELLNDQKLNYSLVNQLYPFFYRTREVLTLVEFEDIEPDVFLVRKPNFNTIGIENTKILIQNYKLLFSNLFSISRREDSLYDGFIYKRYNSSLYLIFIKEFFKKAMIFTNFFVHKGSKTKNNYQMKKSDYEDQEIIGVELVQSRINLSETNDLFFIDNSVIHDEQICLIEYDEKPALYPFLLSSIKKRNEPRMKYGRESYDVISNRKFNRLKIINIINLLTQRYLGEVNSSYSIKNLGSLVGPMVILNYFMSLSKLFFDYKNKDKFLNFLVLQYAFDSKYYSKILKKANLKILWTMFDGGEDQLIKSQAIESAGGYFCGSHWSHYPITCIDNQKCYDILFAWSDHFSEMLNEYYQSKKTFIVGYPSIDYLDKYIHESSRIREMHSDKFIITFNDNTYFNDGPVSEESYYSFYSLALNVLEQFENTIIYLKPKRSNHFNAYIRNNKRFEEFIVEGRVNLLISDHSRSKVPPAFPALFSDLVLGLGLSTTTIESTISGALSFNVISELVFRDNEFFKTGLDKVVYNTKESIIKAIDKAITHKDNGIYLESLESYKILDPYLDKNANTRISKGLLEILENKNY
tara:strand:- start:8445 stop:10490 length:2046 start_codon:yes stop_codon:yes gene_type:complete